MPPLDATGSRQHFAGGGPFEGRFVCQGRDQGGIRLASADANPRQRRDDLVGNFAAGREGQVIEKGGDGSGRFAVGEQTSGCRGQLGLDALVDLVEAAPCAADNFQVAAFGCLLEAADGGRPEKDKCAAGLLRTR